ncbi:kinase-like domain-containing protein [Catenaria anguillulae PL171]|uniref:non-specific serine/threonine protein kinase n=1 Tax=Catenaria anguillulae PL171 TaxID=765915 RepID=A0A1Y2I3Y9_9FUNG|nr:kinase-like domain-containing protein [Catenaria anguillulae PL171]
MLCGLEHIHAHGIAHRDIKADNVVLENNGNGEGVLRAAITDFGIARQVHNRGPSDLCGTLAYIAPEVLNAKSRSTCDLLAADMWAMGITVCAIVNRYLPYDAKTPAKLLECIKRRGRNMRTSNTTGAPLSKALLALIDGLLERDPSKRLTACSALKSAWFATNEQQNGSNQEAAECDTSLAQIEEDGGHDDSDHKPPLVLASTDGTMRKDEHAVLLRAIRHPSIVIA